MSDLPADDEEITPEMRAQAEHQFLMYGLFGCSIVEPAPNSWRSVYTL